MITDDDREDTQNAKEDELTPQQIEAFRALESAHVRQRLNRFLEELIAPDPRDKPIE